MLGSSRERTGMPAPWAACGRKLSSVPLGGTTHVVHSCPRATQHRCQNGCTWSSGSLLLYCPAGGNCHLSGQARKPGRKRFSLPWRCRCFPPLLSLGYKWPPPLRVQELANSLGIGFIRKQEYLCSSNFMHSTQVIQKDNQPTRGSTSDYSGSSQKPGSHGQCPMAQPMLCPQVN